MWFAQPPDPDRLQLLIEDGEACGAVLEMAAFSRVVDALTATHMAQLVASPVGPEGLSERERNHALQAALTSIVQELIARRDAAARALEELRNKDADDNE